MKKRHPYSEKTKKDSRILHFDKNVLWIIKISLMAFVFSFLLSLFSETVMSKSTFWISVIVLLFFIFLGIIFDMIGVATTVADKKVFNSMASKKVKGSKTALKFIKNSSQVSSFCNDVVGDICGILSGSAGVTIALAISNIFSLNILLANLLTTSLIAALTIGGKAAGKSYAINKSNRILYTFSKIIEVITFTK